MKWYGDLLADAEHLVGGTFYEDRRPLNARRIIALWLFSPEFQLTLRYRLARACYEGRWLWLARFIHYRSRIRYASDIHFMATIGPGLRLVHGSDIVIGPLAVLGAGVTVFNGVTIGSALSQHRSDGMPRIGNGVVIGTGAKLLGPITLGDEARVGANAVVLRDVPSGGTAVGVPARIVSGS